MELYRCIYFIQKDKLSSFNFIFFDRYKKNKSLQKNINKLVKLFLIIGRD